MRRGTRRRRMGPETVRTETIAEWPASAATRELSYCGDCECSPILVAKHAAGDKETRRGSTA